MNNEQSTKRYVFIQQNHFLTKELSTGAAVFSLEEKEKSWFGRGRKGSKEPFHLSKIKLLFVKNNR
jgi:hypothetical protein